MKIPYLKANEKLPRGSFFYIKVGHRFYAGEQAETREVVSDPSDKPVLTHYEKDGTQTRDYRNRMRLRYWWTSRSKGPRGRRLQRDVSKGTVPKYAAQRDRPEPVITLEFTGKLTPKLVDGLDQAKQYRSQKKVDDACERIRTCYRGLDVKISVGFEKGETS